jgi:hypothetical protein
MVLPPGINKAAGLGAALDQLHLSPHNVVGIGDAENDHAFMRLCECAVAVSNALPMIKERSDHVTRGAHGAGVAELIGMLIADDLGEVAPALTRHHLLLGTRADRDGADVNIAPYGINLLLAGSSGSGKSTLATAFLERLAEQGYQFCIIDPEGDYEAFEGALTLGDPSRDPSADAVIDLLETSSQHVIVNLLGLALEHRPAFFEQLLPRIQELRARSGRPHWLVIDEAHHLLPTSWQFSPNTLPQELSGLMLITVHPDHVASSVLSLIQMIIAVGAAPEQAIQSFGAALGQPVPNLTPVQLQPGEALVWSRISDQHDTIDSTTPFRLRAAPPSGQRRRHSRKYAEGNLGEDKSFYFRGPEGKLNLRAQNLMLFMQLAAGVDDDTWLYHLRQGDYTCWFRESIKDEELADVAAQVEQQQLDATASRATIAAAIEERYTKAG